MTGPLQHQRVPAGTTPARARLPVQEAARIGKQPGLEGRQFKAGAAQVQLCAAAGGSKGFALHGIRSEGKVWNVVRIDPKQHRLRIGKPALALVAIQQMQRAVRGIGQSLAFRIDKDKARLLRMPCLFNPVGVGSALAAAIQLHAGKHVLTASFRGTHAAHRMPERGIGESSGRLRRIVALQPFPVPESRFPIPNDKSTVAPAKAGAQRLCAKSREITGSRPAPGRQQKKPESRLSAAERLVISNFFYRDSEFPLSRWRT